MSSSIVRFDSGNRNNGAGNASGSTGSEATLSVVVWRRRGLGDALDEDGDGDDG